VKLTKGAKLFANLADPVVAIAPELEGLSAFCFNGDKQREEATTIEFEAHEPVTLLVGYFRDDQRKFAKAPKLEVDAAANEYGQAEPKLINAIRINNMPLANVHPYNFAPGKHKLLLPKGYLVVLGFTNKKEMVTRNAGLAGAEEAVDWLFY
jgi:hypothetical protein